MNKITGPLNGLKNGETPWDIETHSEFYKYATEEFLELVRDEFNQIYERMIVDVSL